MTRYVATERTFNSSHPFDQMLRGRNGWIGVGDEAPALREGALYVYHSRDRVTSQVSRYVYRCRGRGVGVLLVVKLRDKSPIITTVFVLASHRRRGIATKLHARALQDYPSAEPASCTEMGAAFFNARLVR